MSMPTSWADLDWTKATPLDYRYLYSLWQAVAERRHVVRRPDAGVNAFLARRHPGQTPARAEFTALRDAIYAVCDRFIRLDVDYAADAWETWPALWSRDALVGDETRNIALMPDSTDHIAAWGDWMRRAKGCLDALVAACSPTVFDPGGLVDAMWSAKYHEGGTTWWTYPTLAEAIAAAKADEEVSTWFYGYGTRLSFYVHRYRADPKEFYVASFSQRFEWRIMNPTLINALPRLVARRSYGDGVFHGIFDGFGYFQLGVNALDMMTPGEIRLIDDVADVLEPTVMPALPQPDDGQYSVANVTCEVESYFDYRCAGGFQFYTPED